jgi:hypothetical protein
MGLDRMCVDGLLCGWWCVSVVTIGGCVCSWIPCLGCHVCGCVCAVCGLTRVWLDVLSDGLC